MSKYARDILDDFILVVDGKWKAPIIRSMGNGGVRFKYLHETLPKISKKVLSEQLKHLREKSIVTVSGHQFLEIGTCYVLTPLGMEVFHLLEIMHEWLNRNPLMREIGAHRVADDLVEKNDV